MDQERVHEVMGRIDPALIEGADMERKKSLFRSRRAAVIAALAAAAVLLMGAAGVITKYHLLSGLGIVQDSHHFSADFSTAESPIVSEDGRLFLVLDGQRTDITDLVDGSTPYIVSGINTDTGRPSYLIVGGTPYSFGYMEVWVSWGVVGVVWQNQGLSDQTTSGTMQMSLEKFWDGHWKTAPLKPWQSAGLEQLDL